MVWCVVCGVCLVCGGGGVLRVACGVDVTQPVRKWHETAPRSKKIRHVVEGQWHHRHHMQKTRENMCILSSLFPCFLCVFLIMSSFSLCFCVCDVCCVRRNWRRESVTGWFDLSFASTSSVQRTICASISLRASTRNYNLLTLPFSRYIHHLSSPNNFALLEPLSRSRNLHTHTHIHRNTHTQTQSHTPR